MLAGEHSERESSLPPLARVAAVLICMALLVSTCAGAESVADNYKTRCAPCHGDKGAGDTMIGKNLKLRSLASAEVQDQSDQQLDAIINHGKGKMPAYDRKLSRDQIAAIVRYIRSLKK